MLGSWTADSMVDFQNPIQILAAVGRKPSRWLLAPAPA